MFEVECQAGTYIRKLVHDLGEELKVGAHMTELRRIRASIFEEKEAVNLYDFTEAIKEYRDGKEEKLKKMLFPIEIIKKIMPSLFIREEAIEKLKHGSPLFAEMIEKSDKFDKEEFIAVFFENTLIEVAKTQVKSLEIKEVEKDIVIAVPAAVFN